MCQGDGMGRDTGHLSIAGKQPDKQNKNATHTIPLPQTSYLLFVSLVSWVILNNPYRHIYK